MKTDLFKLDCECGCAAKIPAARLKDILKNIQLPQSPNLIVGPDTLDDAGIYRLPDGSCLVQTVDFFPPVARDPYMYGRIAAANSLSDIFAMGGVPITALAVVCFPARSLPTKVLEEITRGAIDKLRETNTVLLGGHSIVDPQPKYGLAVTGRIAADAILDNAGARPGDVLFMTKPLGTGITIMAIKAGMASPQQEEVANQSMQTLNARAAQIATECGAHACTDITGFGLIGHALQVARSSNCSLEIDLSAIPKLDGVLNYASMGLLSGAAYANREYAQDAVFFDPKLELAKQDLLFDPQTSGGLLISCPAGNTEKMSAMLSENITTPWAQIGCVTKKECMIDTEPDIFVKIN